MAESMVGLKRTHRCTEVTTAHIGQEVTVMGWVQKSRNKGGIIFVDLRDRSGILQIIFEENDCGAENFAKAEKLRSEFVVAVTGRVEARSGAVNTNLATGAIEIRANSMRILSESETPPFPIEENSKTKEELRGHEGEAAAAYFGVFDELILQQKKEFFFQGRSKRPPMDNVNALLSFVYTLLANMISSALECVGLDPYVGYFHTDRPGRASLSFDIIEEFRPALADRFVLSLINKKLVNGKGFKKKENGAVIMTDDTKRIVLTEWQNRKKETLTHPFLKEKIEWGMAPYVQALLLARYLRGDLDGYPPFLWK